MFRKIHVLKHKTFRFLWAVGMMLTCMMPASAQVSVDASALQVGHRLLLNGYYADAIATYQVIANQTNLPSETRAAALLGWAEASMRSDLYQDALTPLDRFISEFGGDSLLPRAHFLRGEVHRALANWQASIEDFERYLTLRPGVIDSYVYERIAQAQLALNQTDVALASYALASQSPRNNSGMAGLHERVAQAYIDQNRLVDAVAQYDAILAFAQNPAYRAGIELRAAQIAANAGDSANATIRFQNVMSQYPTRPEAYQAMQILLSQGVEIDPLTVGRTAYHYGDYQGAVDAWVTYQSQTSASEIPAEIYLLLGRAYREVGNSQSSTIAFQTLVSQYPDEAFAGEALLEIGRTFFLNNDWQGAVQQYIQMADQHPNHAQAPEALWRAGFLYSENDQFTQAQPIFERLANDYPTSNQTLDGLWLLAETAQNAGDALNAERYFTEVMNRATGDIRADAALNVGFLAQARGDVNVANAAFNTAVIASPDSYYGTRARDILEGRPAFQLPTSMRFQFDTATEVAEAEAWMRSTFQLTQDGALWVLSPTLAQDPRIVRGQELWYAGAHSEAHLEFDDIITAYTNDALASYQLAIYLRGLGLYPESITAAANVIRLAGVGTTSAPGFIARMRYPAYYLDVVQNASERYSYNPLLMFSLIRHESLFDTEATAAAGEIGLTQVIPATADYIGAQLNFPNYAHALLFRPYVGIEFGSFYLAEQLNLFDGYITAALASYNAGPGRGLTWLETGGRDHDTFLQSITISSTQTYVRRIYGYFSIYRSLYEG